MRSRERYSAMPREGAPRHRYKGGNEPTYVRLARVEIAAAQRALYAAMERLDSPVCGRDDADEKIDEAERALARARALLHVQHNPREEK